MNKEIKDWKQRIQMREEAALKEKQARELIFLEVKLVLLSRCFKYCKDLKRAEEN